MRNNSRSRKPSIFFNYSHAQSELVDSIEQALSNDICVVRDIRMVGIGQSIRQFMRSIRQRDFVLLIVSDASLRSVACMYEIINLWINREDEDFWKKVLLYVVEKDRSRILSTSGIFEYVQYWGSNCKEFELQLAATKEATTPALYKRLQEMRIIRDYISDFLVDIAERLMPNSIDLIQYIKEQISKN